MEVEVEQSEEDVLLSGGTDENIEPEEAEKLLCDDEEEDILDIQADTSLAEETIDEGDPKEAPGDDDIGEYDSKDDAESSHRENGTEGQAFRGHRGGRGRFFPYRGPPRFPPRFMGMRGPPRPFGPPPFGPRPPMFAFRGPFRGHPPPHMMRGPHPGPHPRFVGLRQPPGPPGGPPGGPLGGPPGPMRGLSMTRGPPRGRGGHGPMPHQQQQQHPQALMSIVPG